MPRLLIVRLASAVAMLLGVSALAAPATSTAPATARSTKTIVTKIVADQLGFAEAEIRPGRTLKDLGVDELDIVEIVLALEDSLLVSIPDEALGFKDDPKKYERLTVADLITIVDAARARVQVRPAKPAATGPSPSPATLPAVGG